VTNAPVTGLSSSAEGAGPACASQAKSELLLIRGVIVVEDSKARTLRPMPLLIRLGLDEQPGVVVLTIGSMLALSEGAGRLARAAGGGEKMDEMEYDKPNCILCGDELLNEIELDTGVCDACCPPRPH